jgi:hypothetical protein
MKSQAWAQAFVGSVGILVVGIVAYLLAEPRCLFALILVFWIVRITEDRKVEDKSNS